MLKGFREFIMRGNVVDLAIAVVIGTAFTALVKAFVADILTPIIAAIFGKPNFADLTLTINNSQFLYGDLINEAITFVSVAAAIYFFVVAPLNKIAERRAAKPAAEPLAPVHAPVEGKRSVRQGIVVSDKADKTITVRIDFARRHRRYEKIVRSSSTLHAHDESNDAHEGDTVRVIESRPLSKNKRWKLVDVVERAR